MVPKLSYKEGMNRIGLVKSLSRSTIVPWSGSPTEMYLEQAGWGTRLWCPCPLSFKEGNDNVALFQSSSSHCWKLQALQPLFHQEAEMKTSIH